MPIESARHIHTQETTETLTSDDVRNTAPLHTKNEETHHPTSHAIPVQRRQYAIQKRRRYSVEKLRHYAIWKLQRHAGEKRLKCAPGTYPTREKRGPALPT
jgi:hypothetical protein